MNKVIEELLSEKSLWNIWWKSSSATVGTRGFWVNTIILITACFLVSGFVFTWDADVHSAIELLRTLVSTGVSYSITMLGFLLAGFAIMSGVTRPDLWLSMARTPVKGRNISYLKYNFFTYMRAFIYHIIYLTAFMVAQLIMVPKSIVTKVINQISADPVPAKTLVIKIGIVVFAIAMGHLLIQLKYFVFNVYHSIMTTLAWEFQAKLSKESQEDAKPEDCSCSGL